MAVTLRVEVHHTLPRGLLQAVLDLSTTLGAQMSELTDAVADLDAALNAFIDSENDEDAQAELDRATIATLEAQIAELEDGKQASIDELRKVRDALQAQADANTGAGSTPEPTPEPEPAPPADGGDVVVDQPPANEDSGDTA